MSQIINNNEKKQTLHWSFWFGVVFFVAVILFILSFGFMLNKRLQVEESSPITSIEINGEMQYTTRLDIEQILEHIDLGNFFNVDVNHVRANVAKLPWVYSVSVRKVWPDKLTINVVDQKPVAFWNGNFLINEQGVAFQADISRVNIFLPAFYGPEGTEVLALSNFVNLQKLLKFNELSIEELVLSARHAWQLTLNDGVTLRLGRDKNIERIQRFMDIYPQITLHRKAGQEVNYIDLRYDTGMAVGWKVTMNEKRV